MSRLCVKLRIITAEKIRKTVVLPIPIAIGLASRKKDIICKVLIIYIVKNPWENLNPWGKYTRAANFPTDFISPRIKRLN